MRYLLTALCLLPACLDDAAKGESCEAIACAHVPDCSPLTTGAWDLRTEAACLESFACGETPEACLDALLALPCLSDPPTWEEIEANTRALKLVREVCR